MHCYYKQERKRNTINFQVNDEQFKSSKLEKNTYRKYS